MYFFVREGFSLTQHTEGFCDQLNVISEMLNGQICVDGYDYIHFGLGETLHLKAADEKLALTNLKVNVNDF